jgi:tetratricopeptide (TPR) repeat protein
MRSSVGVIFGYFFIPILLAIFMVWWLSGNQSTSKKRFSLKRLIILLVVLFGASVISLVVFETFLDRNNFKQALDACQAGQFEESIQYFDKILNSEPILDISGFLVRARTEKTNCLIQYASVSEQTNDSKHALLAYTYLVELGEVESVRGQIASLFERFEASTLAEINICDRVDILTGNNLIPNDEANAPPLYLACGQFYWEENQTYQKTIDIYTDLVAQYPNSEQTLIALSVLEDLYYDLAQDTGSLGTSIIKNAWTQICAGELATSLTVGLINSEPRLWFQGNALTIPDEFMAKSPGQFHYAICLSEYKVRANSCRYAGTKRKVIYNLQATTVTVRDTQTAEIIREKTFTGSSDSSCPPTIVDGQQDIVHTGNKPSGEEINAWIQKEIFDGNLPLRTGQTILDTALNSTRETINNNASATAEAIASEETKADATINADAYATATTQAIISGEATLQATESNWNIVFEDSFDSNNHNWGGNNEEEFFQITRSFDEGVYVWDIETIQSSHIFADTYDLPEVSDFSITIDVKQSSGPTNTPHGIIFRFKSVGEGFYYFVITKVGLFSIGYFDSINWLPILDWEQNSAIRANDENKLVVIAEGSEFRFFVNGQQVAVLSDERLASGSFVLMAFVDAQKSVRLEFDNLKLQTPP